jgi:beta-lactamase class A
LPFYEKENLIVNVQELRDYLKALPEQNKDWAEMSIYFEVMNTGANITVNPDSKIWPASLMKLPIGMAAMEKVEKGEWSLDETMFELTAEDVDLITAPEVAAEVGKEYSLNFLLERLLLVSDNAAFNILSRNISQDEFSIVAEEVGLEQLITDDEKLSAKDYTRLFRALYQSTYLDEKHSQMMLELLDRSEFNEFLNNSFPPDVPFAHKWGANLEYNVYADSGILFVKDKPVMISVMIQGKDKDVSKSNEKAKKLFKEIGEFTYQFMRNAQNQ